MSGQIGVVNDHRETIVEGLESSRWVRWCMYSLMAFPIIDFGLRNLPHVHPLGSIWDKIVLLILAGFALRRWISGYRPAGLRWPMYAGWFIAFTCALMFSDLSQVMVSIEGFRFDIYYILYPLLIPFVVAPRDVPKLLHVGAMVAVLIGIHGIFQYVVKVPTPSSWTDASESVRTRVFSVLTSSNELGPYMAMNIPLLLGMFMCEKNRWRKWLYGLGVPICGLTFLFTLNRGAWMALVLSLLIVAILFDRRLLLGLVVIAGIAFFIPTVQHRIGELLSPVYWIKSSQSGRLFKWNTAFDKLATNPLFGYGLGRYGGAVSAVHHTSVYSDNYYAKTFGETGLIGVTLFIAMHLALLRDVLRRAVRMAPRDLRYILIGGMVGLLAVVIHNTMENVFEFAPMVVTYFTYAALFLVWGQGFGKNQSEPAHSALDGPALREEGIADEARQ
jgi:hypothetical protein